MLIFRPRVLSALCVEQTLRHASEVEVKTGPPPADQVREPGN